GPVIKKLSIEGAKQLKAKELEKRILTEQTGKIPLLSKKQHFDPNVWRSDLRRVERYYRERGYYQARVTGDEVKPVGNDAVALTIKVDEGEATRVALLDISGLDALPKDQHDQLLGDIPVKQGDVFIEDKWEGLKAELEHHLKELGYAEADVEGQAQVDLEARRAEVHVQIDPGVRYKFGEVRVTSRDKK